MTTSIYIVLSKRFYLLLVLSCVLFYGISIAQDKDSLHTGYVYYINSTPFNAEVVYKDSILGLTPARFFSSDKLTGVLTVRKAGYENAEIDLNVFNFETGTDVFLKKLAQGSDNIVQKNRGTLFVKKRNLAGIITAGLLAVTGGALSFNSKEKANDFYSQYIVYGNRDNLDKSKRYDVYYGLSLAVMQVSVGALIYFLFLE